MNDDEKLEALRRMQQADPALAELEALVELLTDASTSAQRSALKLARRSADEDLARARALLQFAPRLSAAASRIAGYAVGHDQRDELTRGALQAAEPLKLSLAGDDHVGQRRHLEQLEAALDRLEGL